MGRPDYVIKLIDDGDFLHISQKCINDGEISSHCFTHVINYAVASTTMCLNYFEESP